MKRSWISWLAILATMMMVFSVVGCSDDDDTSTNPPVVVDQSAMVIAAGDDYFDDYLVTFNGTSMGVNVPPANFYANYTDYYVVDVRGAADFAGAHVIGAHNIPIGNLVDEIDNLPTDQIILFMCYSGQTASFATAIVNLIGTETGHVAQNLKFGASELMPESLVKADGSYAYNPNNDYLLNMVTTPSPAKHAATDYPVINTGESTAVEVLKNRARAAIATWSNASCRADGDWALNTPMDEAYLINYFSEPNFLDGHLPNAINYVPGAFTSATDLATLPTDMPIGVYCYTGQTSAQVVAYLQMLGYDAKTVMYGVQRMAYDDPDINDAKWHAADNSYLSILEGTIVPQ